MDQPLKENRLLSQAEPVQLAPPILQVAAGAPAPSQPVLTDLGIAPPERQIVPFVPGQTIEVDALTIGDLPSFLAEPGVWSFQDDSDLVVMHVHDGLRDVIRVTGYFSNWPAQSGQVPPITQADQVIQQTQSQPTLHGDVSQDQLTTQQTSTAVVPPAPSDTSTSTADTISTDAVPPADATSSSSTSAANAGSSFAAAPASSGATTTSTSSAAPTSFAAPTSLASSSPSTSSSSSSTTSSATNGNGQANGGGQNNDSPPPTTPAPTSAPTTQPPATDAATTQPPATQPPATTQAPVTTEAPTTQPPTTVPSDSSQPDTGGGSPPATTNPDYIVGPGTLVGNSGNDTIIGTAGHQLITGGSNTSTITGVGFDTIDSGTGSSTITSGGNDLISFEANTAILNSGGNDTVSAGSGSATIQGGGSDSITASAGDLTVTLGGAANTVNLAAGAATVTGTTGSDTITGGGTGNVLVDESGNSQPQSVAASAAHETILGGAGALTITGAAGTDSIVAGSGAAVIDLSASSGDATITAAHGDATIVASAGADLITLGSGNASVTGGTGSDTIILGSGAASIAAGSGPQIIQLDDTTGASAQIRSLASGDYIELGTLSGAALLTEAQDAIANQVTNGADRAVTLDGGGVVSIVGIGRDLSFADFKGLNTFEVTGNAASYVDGTDTAAGFTVTRQGDLSNAADVVISLGGSAVSGSDYSGPTTITASFAAGQASASITVPLLNNTVPGPDATLTASVGSSAEGGVDSVNASASETLTNPNRVHISVGNVTVGEGTTAMVQVSLDQPAATDIVFDYATSVPGANGALSSQYASASGTATIAAGASSIFIPVTTVADGSFELTRDLALGISNIQSTTPTSVSSAVGTITINNADPAPVFSVLDTTVNESDGTATITIQRTGTTSEPTTLTLGTADGTATQNTDYAPLNQTVTWLPTDPATKTVTVSLIDNGIQAPDKNFQVAVLSAGTAGTAGAAGTVTIHNDNVNVALGGASQTVQETDGHATFTLSIPTPLGEDVTINYVTANQTGDGTNFTPTTGSITIAAGQTSAQVQVPILDTGVYHASDPSFAFNVTSVTRSGAGPLPTITVGSEVTTIHELDPKPTFNIGDISVDESAGVAHVQITRVGATAVDTTLTLGTTDGTAIAGHDYTGGPITFAFAATDPNTKTVDVPLLSTSDTYASRSFELGITDPGAAGIAGSSGTVTIVDDERKVSLSGATATVNETDGTVSVNIALDQAVSVGDQMVVTVQLVPGTADSSAYGPLPGMPVTIPAGQSGATVSIPINDVGFETLVGSSTNFGVQISSASLASGSPVAILGSAETVNIVDQDAAPTISISAPTITEGGDAVFTITRTGNTVLPTVMNIATLDETAKAGVNYTAINEQITIPGGGASASTTVTVHTADDATYTPNLTFGLTASGITNAAQASVSSQGTIQNIDEGLGFSGATQSVNETAGTATVTLTTPFAVPLGDTLTATVSLVPGTADASAYGPFTPTTITIAGGQSTATVNVPINDVGYETVVGSSTNFQLHISAASLASGTPVSLTQATTTVSIVDQDAAPTVTVSNPTVNEGGDLVFTVTRTGPTTLATTFNYSTADGTATAGPNYTGVSGTATIAAGGGTGTQTITVHTTEDHVSTPNLTTLLNLSGIANAASTTAQGTGTITNIDNLVSLGASAQTVLESAGSAGIPITLAQPVPAGDSMVVNYAIAAGTATNGEFTAPATGSITIAAGASSGSIPVTINDVGYDGPIGTGHNFSVSITGASMTSGHPVTLTGAAADTVTINSTDAAPTITMSSPAVNEGGNLVFTVTRNGATVDPVVLNIATADGTGVAGVNYTALSEQITIPAGGSSGSQTVTVHTLDDGAFTPNLTVNLNATGITNAAVGSASTTGTIANIDEGLSFASPSQSVNETAGTVAIAINTPFAVPLGDTLTATIALVAGTADASAYGPLGSTTVTIAGGQSTATVNIPINDVGYETIVGSTTNFGVKITAAALASGTPVQITQPNTTINIVDQDAAPTISVSSPTVNEGGDATFTITRTGNSVVPITLHYATQDGSALAGTNYTAASGNITLPGGAGGASTTVTVHTLEDHVSTANLGFTLGLSSITNAANTTASGAATVDNIDNLVSLGSSSQTVSETVGSMNVTLQLTQPVPAGDSMVLSYSTAAITATNGEYTAPATGQVTIGAGQSSVNIPVTINDVGYDGTIGTAHTLQVSITGASMTSGHPVTIGGSLTDTVSITAADAAPTISISSPTVNEGGNLVFTFTRTGTTVDPVVLNIATADGTGVAGVNYTALSQQITIPGGGASGSQTVTVHTLDDGKYTGDLSVTLNATGITNAAVTSVSGSGTIHNIDEGLAFGSSSQSVNETAGTVAISLNTPFAVPLGDTLSATIALVAGTADASAYGPLGSATVTIVGGQNTATVNIPINDVGYETIVGGSTNFGVKITAASLASGTPVQITQPNTTINIVDQDAAPTVSVSSPTVNEGGDAVFTVTRTGNSVVPITFSYATQDGTAHAGANYTAASGAITLPGGAGGASTTITVHTTEDHVSTANLGFALNLTGITNAGNSSTTGSASVTNIDNLVSLGSSSQTVSESAGSTNVTLQLGQPVPAGDSMVVSYSTSAITATNGEYTAPATGQVTIAAGQSSANIPITINDVGYDGTFGTAHTMQVSITGATMTSGHPVTIGGSLTDTVNITAADAAPTVSISNPTVNEGGNLVFTVTRTGATVLPVTMTIGTSDGTAHAGANYTAVNETITIPGGGASNSANVTVSTIHDNAVTNNLSLSLNATSITNAANTSTSGTGIVDNVDGAVSLGATSQSVNDTAGSINIPILLSQAVPAGDQMFVNYSISAGTATNGEYTHAATGTVTIAAGQSSANIPVTINNLGYDGGSGHTFSVALTSASMQSGNPVTVSGSADTVTINNTVAAPSYSIAGASANEGNQLDFQVSVTGAHAVPVVVTYSESNGTAVAGTNFTSSSGSITIAAGASTGDILINSIDDHVVTANTTFTLNSTATNTANPTSSATGTVVNTDAPAISIATVTAAEGNFIVVNATLNQAVGAPVSFDWSALTDGTAAASRYTAAGASATHMTIPAGQTSATFTIGGAVHDNVYEGGPGATETMHVQLSNITGPVSNAGSTVTGTVNLADIDSPPVITVSAAPVIRGQNEVFTVTRTGQTDQAVTGHFATANGTGTAGVDYTATSGNFTIAAGGASGATTVSVPTANTGSTTNFTDSLNLTSIVGGNVSTISGSETVFGNQVHITDASVNGSNLVFTVLAQQAVASNTVLNWNRTDMNGAASIIGGGFGGQVTIPAGQSSATISLPISATPGVGGPGLTKLTLTGSGISIVNQPAFGEVDGGSARSQFTAAEINTGAFQPVSGFNASDGNAVGSNGTEYFLDERNYLWYGNSLASAFPTMTRISNGGLTGNIVVPLSNGNIAIPVSTGYGIYSPSGTSLNSVMINTGFMTGFPYLAGLQDGSGFVVAYNTNSGGQSLINYSIVNNDGSVRQAFTQIALTGPTALNITDITVGPNGGLTILGFNSGGTGLGEWAIPLDSSGVPGVPVLLAGTSGGTSGAEIIQTQTGFAEVYKTNNGPNQFSNQNGVNVTGYNTMLQLWDAHGNAQGAAINITNITYIGNSTDQVAIANIPGGGFAVAWSTYNLDTIMSESLNIAFFNAQGQQIGKTQTPVSGGTSNGGAEIADIAIHALASGQVLLTAGWSGEGAGSSNSEFYSVVYNPDGTFAHEYNNSTPFVSDGSISGAHGTVITGDANDTVAGSGNQAIFLGAGNDSVTASTGTNQIFGGAGNDTINASQGLNQIYAGNGSSSITASGQTTIIASTGAETISGTTGTVVDFSHLSSPLTINLSAQTVSGSGVVSSISGIHDIYGTNRGDTITGDASNDLIVAGSGNNSILGGSGTYIVETGGGNNTIDQGGGVANIFTGAGNDLITIENTNFGVINAGGGTNTLDINVGGTIDMTTLTNQILHVQDVDLTGTPSQTLHISTTNIQLGLQQITGTADDTVVLRMGAWVEGASTTIGGIKYDTWSRNGYSVQVDDRATIVQMFDNVAPKGFHEKDVAPLQVTATGGPIASILGDSVTGEDRSIHDANPLLTGASWIAPGQKIGFSIWADDTHVAGKANTDVVAAIQQAFEIWGKTLGVTFVDETKQVAGETMANNGSDISIDLSGGLLKMALGSDSNQYLGTTFGLDESANNILLSTDGASRSQFQTIEGDIGLAANIGDAGLKPGQAGFYAIMQEIGHAVGVGQISPELLAQVLGSGNADPTALAAQSTAVEGVALDDGASFASAPGGAEGSALKGLIQDASSAIVHGEKATVVGSGIVDASHIHASHTLTTVSMDGTTQQTLVLSAAEIDAMTKAGKTLAIDGTNTQATIVLEGGGWQLDGKIVIGGQSYSEEVKGNTHLLVADGLNVVSLLDHDGTDTVAASAGSTSSVTGSTASSSDSLTGGSTISGSSDSITGSVTPSGSTTTVDGSSSTAGDTIGSISLGSDTAASATSGDTTSGSSAATGSTLPALDTISGSHGVTGTDSVSGAATTDGSGQMTGDTVNGAAATTTVTGETVTASAQTDTAGTAADSVIATGHDTVASNASDTLTSSTTLDTLSGSDSTVGATATHTASDTVSGADTTVGIHGTTTHTTTPGPTYVAHDVPLDTVSTNDSDPLHQTRHVALGADHVITIGFFADGSPLPSGDDADIVSAINTATADIGAKTGVHFVTLDPSLAGTDVEHSQADIAIDLDPAVMSTLLGSDSGKYMGITLSQNADADRLLLDAAGLDGSSWTHPAGTIMLDGGMLEAAGLGNGQAGLATVYQELEHALGIAQVSDALLAHLSGEALTMIASTSTLAITHSAADGQWATSLGSFEADQIRTLFSLPDPSLGSAEPSAGTSSNGNAQATATNTHAAAGTDVATSGSATGSNSAAFLASIDTSHHAAAAPPPPIATAESVHPAPIPPPEVQQPHHP